jgi:NAD(P)-dependent dehydrogenase (short-subunit alcohol dehydrogenase family)
MSLYRARPEDGCAWITGGSSGIGLALAQELVRRGYKVAISARNFDHFHAASAENPDLGRNIFAFPCDVTSEDDVARTMVKIIRDLGPVALAVFNAGNYIPLNGNALSADAFRKTFDVNFHGAVNGLVPVIAHMSGNGRGQIAITGSVTSYGGLPTAAAYGASKAALNSMVQSLKFDLDRMNIRIQICNPGFVISELTKKNDFAMPGLMETGVAAKRYADGLERGGFEIRYPRRLAWPLRFVSVLPSPLYFWFIAKATGTDKPLE